MFFEIPGLVRAVMGQKNLSAIFHHSLHSEIGISNCQSGMEYGDPIITIGGDFAIPPQVDEQQNVTG